MQLKLIQHCKIIIFQFLKIALPKHTQTQFFLSPSSYGFTLSSFFSTLITICDNLVQLVIVCSPHINSVRVGIYHSYLLLYPQCWTELNEQMNEEKFELSYEEYVSIFQGNKYCVCGRGQGGSRMYRRTRIMQRNQSTLEGI